MPQDLGEILRRETQRIRISAEGISAGGGSAGLEAPAAPEASGASGSGGRGRRARAAAGGSASSSSAGSGVPAPLEAPGADAGASLYFTSMLARAMVERWEAPITPNGGTKSQTLKSVIKSRQKR